MQRRNGSPLRMQRINAESPDDVGGRIACRDCGRLVPRGSDRPFCLDHAPYAQALMRDIEAAPSQINAA